MRRNKIYKINRTKNTLVTHCDQRRWKRNWKQYSPETYFISIETHRLGLSDIVDCQTIILREYLITDIYMIWSQSIIWFGRILHSHDEPTSHGQTCLVRTSDTSGSAPCLDFPFPLVFFLFPFFFLRSVFFFPFFNLDGFDSLGNASRFTKPFLLFFLLAFVVFFLLVFLLPGRFHLVGLLPPLFSFLEGLCIEGPSGGSSRRASSGSTEGRCFGPLVPLTPHTETHLGSRNFDFHHNYFMDLLHFCP